MLHSKDFLSSGLQYHGYDIAVQKVSNGVGLYQSLIQNKIAVGNVASTVVMYMAGSMRLCTSASFILYVIEYMKYIAMHAFK